MSQDDELPPVDIERFADIYRLTRRESTYQMEGFDPTNPPTWNALKILVVGAGGLGCELLHNLALSGFQDIHVIDMDTIDLTNLNRQFLFRQKDVGQPKSTVAAAFINDRFPWVKVTPHFGRIENETDDFYREFHLVILGLDSIHARQWMCAKLASLREPEVNREDGTVSFANATPVIDGGTEGFKGSVRHISLGKNACFDCAMYLYPPTKMVPMCTLENVPRVPEHCVLYVKEKTWVDDAPFGKDVKVDGDDTAHIEWICGKAKQRQEQFKIAGEINFRFTQGVVKNVVPAVGFTNAMVAAMCVNEAIKLATGVAKIFDCFMFYDGANGICSYVQPLWANPECGTCQAQSLTLSKSKSSPNDIVAALAKLPATGAVPNGPADKPPMTESGKPAIVAGAHPLLKFAVPGLDSPVAVQYPDSHPLSAGVTAQFPRDTPVFDKLLQKAPSADDKAALSTYVMLDVAYLTASYNFLVTWTD